MPRKRTVYDSMSYQRARAALLSTHPHCTLRLVCNGAPADSADHDPPLALHAHVEGSGCCVLYPACSRCQRVQGANVARLLRRGITTARTPPAPSREW